MPVVNEVAAGIDVSSTSHFAGIGQNKEDVKEFGVFTEDLHALCKHLVANKITTVALESTGSYWQPLFVLLQQYNLNPILVNGKFTKNVKGRKTDVQDGQCLPVRSGGDTKTAHDRHVGRKFPARPVY